MADILNLWLQGIMERCGAEENLLGYKNEESEGA